jgi:hypothetical protein
MTSWFSKFTEFFKPECEQDFDHYAKLLTDYNATIFGGYVRSKFCEKKTPGDIDAFANPGDYRRAMLRLESEGCKQVATGGDYNGVNYRKFECPGKPGQCDKQQTHTVNIDLFTTKGMHDMGPLPSDIHNLAIKKTSGNKYSWSNNWYEYVSLSEKYTVEELQKKMYEKKYNYPACTSNKALDKLRAEGFIGSSPYCVKRHMGSDFF